MSKATNQKIDLEARLAMYSELEPIKSQFKKRLKDVMQNKNLKYSDFTYLKTSNQDVSIDNLKGLPICKLGNTRGIPQNFIIKLESIKKLAGEDELFNLIKKYNECYYKHKNANKYSASLVKSLAREFYLQKEDLELSSNTTVLDTYKIKCNDINLRLPLAAIALAMLAELSPSFDGQSNEVQHTLALFLNCPNKDIQKIYQKLNDANFTKKRKCFLTKNEAVKLSDYIYMHAELRLYFQDILDYNLDDKNGLWAFNDKGLNEIFSPKKTASSISIFVATDFTVTFR